MIAFEVQITAKNKTEFDQIDAAVSLLKSRIVKEGRNVHKLALDACVQSVTPYGTVIRVNIDNISAGLRDKSNKLSGFYYTVSFQGVNWFTRGYKTTSPGLVFKIDDTIYEVVIK